MNCKTAQFRTLASHRSAELEAHLAACEACREFARARQVFARPVAPPTLPAVVHEQILLHSRRLMREQAHEIARAPDATRRGLARGFALAATMVLYCVLLLLAVRQFQFAVIGYWLLGLAVAQNLFAVLFAPLVFARLRLRTASAQ